MFFFFFVQDGLVPKNPVRGFSGKSCLLRSICEVSMHSIDGASGVIGNILHIILTPSSSKNFGLPPEYEEAENMGQTAHHCTTYHKNCSISIVDLITSLADYE
ncbi:hypothetical protein JTB14_007277 [Gonioctena quinquepunctata]|nr:hypothetical protein JTB14_007277 [Gonioctena quinquepunctata]